MQRWLGKDLFEKIKKCKINPFNGSFKFLFTISYSKSITHLEFTEPCN